MLEIHLAEAKKLFHIAPSKLRNTLPFEESLIQFNDSFIEAVISQRYNKDEKTYCVFATIVYSDRLFDQDSKVEVINTIFIENQKTLNEYVAIVLGKEGIIADASEKGLYLGNGRSISTNGLWMMYRTNNYNFCEEDGFISLMEEEMNLVSGTFAVFYALIQSVIDGSLLISDIQIPAEDYEFKNLAESTLVNQFVNKEVTERLNSLFFTGVSYLETAENLLQQSYLKTP